MQTSKKIKVINLESVLYNANLLSSLNTEIIQAKKKKNYILMKRNSTVKEFSTIWIESYRK